MCAVQSPFAAESWTILAETEVAPPLRVRTEVIGPITVGETRYLS